MAESSAADDPAIALARRLRELRRAYWPGIELTQRQLAVAIGDGKPVSGPLVSSWENTNKPVTPPAERLSSYAAFFATRRSVEQQPYRLIPWAELTDDERQRREHLDSELQSLRDVAVRAGSAGDPGHADDADDQAERGGPWRFADQKPVTIVCGEAPATSPGRTSPFTYGELYSYADIDALFELYGHVRATNPTVPVVVRKVTELEPRDYSTHLVLLGGHTLTTVQDYFLDRFAIPGHVVGIDRTTDPARLIVADTDRELRLAPHFTAAGRLAMDVGYFYRGVNPVNRKRTLTVCLGMTGTGTLGVVRALTDERFRHRNTAVLNEQLADRSGAGLAMTVHVVADRALTPDWTQPDTRLFDWPAS